MLLLPKAFQQDVVALYLNLWSVLFQKKGILMLQTTFCLLNDPSPAHLEEEFQFQKSANVSVRQAELFWFWPLLICVTHTDMLYRSTKAYVFTALWTQEDVELRVQDWCTVIIWVWGRFWWRGSCWWRWRRQGWASATAASWRTSWCAAPIAPTPSSASQSSDRPDA